MRRLIAITVIVMMVLLLLPAWAFAENDGSSQQIGNYFNVSGSDGTISGPVPGLENNTPREYENGKVTVNKTISDTDTENVFDITLDVSVDGTVTFDVQETSGDAAAVLVVDLSSSMTNAYRNSTKIAAANDAIDAFVAQFRKDMNGSTRYIAVVGFGGYSGNKYDDKDGAKTHLGWKKVESNTAISDLSVKTGTGTNLEAGLILAKNLLGQKLYNGKNEEITNKSIILLSDGKPTYYVNGNEKNSTRTDVICANGSHMGGNGSDTEHACHTPVETLMHSEGFKGIHKYAVYIGGRNDELDCKSNNCPDRKTGIQEWLGSECGFTTILADGAGNIDLGTVFKNIATHITLEGTPGLVTDPMGQIIDIQTVGGQPVGSPVVGNEINVADNILGWNLLKADHTEEGNIKKYSLTYQVTLDNLDANFHKGVFYPTNGVTDLPYAIMENDQVNRTGIAYFNIPSVKGFTGDLTFKKVDEAGKGLEGAEFTLSHDKSSHHFTNNDDFSMTALSDSNGTVTFENIPSGHTYTLEETSAPAGYIKSVDVYTVEVNYGVVSVTKDGVPVVSNGGSFTVSNKRDVTSLTVNKVWKYDGYAGVTPPGSISVQLYADGIHYGDPVTLTSSGSWSHTWNDLPRTNDGKVINYTVEETSGHLDYDAEYSDMEAGVITITNTYAPQHGKLKIVKIFAGDVGSAPEGFDADFIVTGPDNYNYKKTISWADFKDGHYVLEGLNEGDYTVEEVLKSSTEGYEVAVMYKEDSPVPVAVSVHPHSEAYTEVTNTYYGIAPYDDDGDDGDDGDDDDQNDGGGGGHHHHHHDSGIIIPTFVPKSGDASVLGYGAMAAAAAMAVIYRRRK